MLGIDTNVLLRFLVQDDPIQSAVATQVIRRRCTKSDPGFVSLVALAETVWVLESVYGLPLAEVAEAVERLLTADTLRIQNGQEVNEAAIAHRSGRVDFADALIGALGRQADCSTTLTFDRRASRLPSMTLLSLKG
jgi:predicted nucleic-acid-binding protein